MANLVLKLYLITLLSGYLLPVYFVLLLPSSGQESLLQESFPMHKGKVIRRTAFLIFSVYIFFSSNLKDFSAGLLLVALAPM